MTSAASPATTFGPSDVAEGMLRDERLVTTERCGNLPGDGDKVYFHRAHDGHDASTWSVFPISISLKPAVIP